MILSDRYSSTVFEPLADLSAILIILFRVSKLVITFLMPFNDFLVKLFLIWRVINSSCAMMESLKCSWSCFMSIFKFVQIGSDFLGQSFVFLLSFAEF